MSFVPVVAVVNRKGGVGKTTSAVSVAAALALAGHRTLLVDLDPQASAGAALGIAASDGAGASAGFRGKGAWDVAYPAHEALFRLGVVAADAALAETEAALHRDEARRDRLAGALRRQRDHWAFVVLDLPPALGGLADAALRAADGVLVPVAADFLALDATRATLATIRSAEKRRGRRFAPIAVLPTFVDRRAASTAAVALLRRDLGDIVLDTHVPRSARFDSGALAGLPIGVTAPTSAPALVYADVAEQLARLLQTRPERPARRPEVKRFVRADMRTALRDLRSH
jgi:chromosome partitioning protein